MASDDETRRRFLFSVAGASAGILCVAQTADATAAKRETHAAGPQEEEVGATEDLMREHGVLRRLLLIYGEVLRRFDARHEVKPELLAQPAEIIRSFIEEYHEKDEEQYIFPRFQKAGRMVDLVNVLLQQHQAGRKLTADILRLSTAAGLANPADRQRLGESMRLFIRMYEPHAAREDTVLFPAFREMVGPKELDKLKDLFEEKEKALPRGGFEKMVAEVQTIEQALGIYDLSRFTPR